MRVLATGKLGSIGTILSPILAEAGHEVVGLDADIHLRGTFSASGSLPNIPTIRKDMPDVAFAMAAKL